MVVDDVIPGLFRTEYRKIVSVLCSYIGFENVDVAEDLTSETFLSAVETWSANGIPENPPAWLYAVAKNRAKNYIKHASFVREKANPDIKRLTARVEEPHIEITPALISDSQLAMIFWVCNPVLSAEAQISLALNLLCGFGVQEVADAFLTNKEVIYKRINRAKEKLREQKVVFRQPSDEEITERLDTVLRTCYLLFSEGYYSTAQSAILRRDVCDEAIRLALLLAENPRTSEPSTFALLALMHFHASRFNARSTEAGDPVLYEDQDHKLWDEALIDKGHHYMNLASTGNEITRYHLEAAIAYWHTRRDDGHDKWNNIFQYYNQLLVLEYSPVAALNRTYALSKVYGKERAISEASKLNLDDNHFYFCLLGHLYTGVDNEKARSSFSTALKLARTPGEKTIIQKRIDELTGGTPRD